MPIPIFAWSSSWVYIANLRIGLFWRHGFGARSTMAAVPARVGDGRRHSESSHDLIMVNAIIDCFLVVGFCIFPYPIPPISP